MMFPRCKDLSGLWKHGGAETGTIKIMDLMGKTEQGKEVEEFLTSIVSFTTLFICFVRLK